MTALTAPPLSQRVVESLVTRASRLPPQTTTYTIGRHLIPMRDGVDLIADVYEPAHGSGTILVRSPYGYPMPLAVMSGSWLARRGYRVVMARCRGTYGSGGRFDPFRDDVADGADTVA